MAAVAEGRAGHVGQGKEGKCEAVALRLRRGGVPEGEDEVRKLELRGGGEAYCDRLVVNGGVAVVVDRAPVLGNVAGGNEAASG